MLCRAVPWGKMVEVEEQVTATTGSRQKWQTRELVYEDDKLLSNDRQVISWFH